MEITEFFVVTKRDQDNNPIEWVRLSAIDRIEIIDADLVHLYLNSGGVISRIVSDASDLLADLKGAN